MATNIDNNLLQELERADEYNEKIESEMNNILKESDCVLVKAESQLMGIINNDTFKKIEKDIENSSESSCALSIDVSNDLFNEFNNEPNISAIYPPSVDKILPTKLPDVLDEPKELEAKKLTEDEDLTNENNETLGASLEITITNDPGDDNENNELETTLLNNSSTFQGCSEEFASNGVEQKITVIVDVEKGRSVSEHKIEETPKNEIANILQEIPLNEAADNQPTTIIKAELNNYNEPINILSANQNISLKRPNDENDPLDVAKKLKLDNLTKTNETITEFDQTQTEYSQVIFDPDETADANDPKWSQFNNNLSIEEHFESVRKQWRSMALPNPHKNLTTRFVPENRKYNSETPANMENEYGYMTCVQYLDNKINRYTQKVNAMYVKLNYLPQSNRGRSQRNKILREIDEMQKFVIEIVKNREEIQQNFMFYQHPSNTWNANYLTRTELDELKEQERLLDFQKRFYSE